MLPDDMRRFVFLVLLLVPGLLPAEPIHRYIVATRQPFHAGMMRQAIPDVSIDPQMVIAERNVVSFESVNGFAADLTESEAVALAKEPAVKSVYLAKERHILDSTAARNSTGQTTPWGITSVRAPDAWTATRGDGINVVVVDTGVDVNHPDLAPLYAGGINELAPSTLPIDDMGHGTHVSGTIAAADNDIGVVGVAPHVHLWAVKVLNSKGSGTDDKVIKAIDWVISQKNSLGGDWVISLSLASPDPDDLEKAAFQRAADAGILAVAAAGNESQPGSPSPVDYPAGYPTVLAVGAVDSTSTIADFSNQGPEVALVAPGLNVLSTLPVGTGAIADVTVNGSTRIVANALVGSPKRTISGQFVYCNLGEQGDFPASVAGKIALIKRGDITFHDKVQNAKAAGATAVVIFNKDTSDLNWTLIGQTCDANNQNCIDNAADVAFDWPLSVGISLDDGNALLGTPNATLSASNRTDDYGVLSGTSMATPHVSGVAALVWSLAPAASAEQIKNALYNSAHDLGAAGRDVVYGFGEVDAYAAAILIAPQIIDGVQPTEPPLHLNHGNLRRGH
jgi:serine protease